MVIIPNVLVISVKAAIFILFAVTALFFLVPLIYGMVHRDEDTVRAGIVGLIIPAFGIICAFLAFYCSLAVQLVIIWAAFALFRTVLPLIYVVVNDDPDLKQRGVLSLPSLVVIGLLFYLFYVNLVYPV